MEEKAAIFAELASLPSGILVSFPYLVVDATLADFLDRYRDANAYPFRFRRTELTSGSSRYLLSAKGGSTSVSLGEFQARAVKPEFTVVNVSVDTTNPDKDAAEGILKYWLDMFSRWIVHEQEHTEKQIQDTGLGSTGDSPTTATMVEYRLTDFLRSEIDRLDARLNQVHTLVTQKPEPKPRGRRPEEINDWIRQQILRGRNQRELFQEYLKKRGIDPDDEDKVDLAKEAFRKVLSRTKRT